MTDQTVPEISEQERKEWINQQLQKANKHLAENGIVVSTVDEKVSRYLLPFFAVWKVKASDNKFYWALSGDLPADFIAGDNAKNAREALRHFALSWQIKAENLVRSGIADQTQMQFAGILQNRAEKLHDFAEEDAIWRN
ncbi:DUF4826 family protein [Aestuariibacter sp. A3R04]|uniref:DUF4826 family protein n=1 Tax=Aestuariibacter sp. A3R04 TaxID=2841571 RepID=UPI001C08436A|nr:DUF4826 family protein [Aestuariibacter sp. A3R04]MBU3023094.1 DUF4826 family protein [Aestuariibacter sp. A3R04]